MNQEFQQNDESFSLPKPHEQGKQPDLNNEQAGMQSESEATTSFAREQGRSVAMPSPDAGIAAPSIGMPSAATTTSMAGTSTSGLVADDGDLIEKEWVVKAKEIVERTKLDPYVQNKEINRVKADYMKKRYNKEIKLTEDG